MSALPRNTTIALLLVVTVCALLVLADVTRADPTNANAAEHSRQKRWGRGGGWGGGYGMRGGGWGGGYGMRGGWGGMGRGYGMGYPGMGYGGYGGMGGMGGYGMGMGYPMMGMMGGWGRR